MNSFRLIFSKNTTIIERKLKDGRIVIREINPDKHERDAKLLEDLLNSVRKDN